MTKPVTKIYGLHLILDGYGASREKLSDVGLIYKTLNELPGLMGMTKVGFPHIIQFKEGDIAGISGFIFIVESHISIHTYSKKGFISMDAYSCREFDHKIVVKSLTKTFKIKETEINLVKRGKKFPL